MISGDAISDKYANSLYNLSNLGMRMTLQANPGHCNLEK